MRWFPFAGQVAAKMGVFPAGLVAAVSTCPVRVGSSRLTGRVRGPERWREVHFRSFTVKPDLQGTRTVPTHLMKC